MGNLFLQHALTSQAGLLGASAVGCPSTRPPQPRWPRFVTNGAAEEAEIAVLAPIWSDENGS